MGRGRPDSIDQSGNLRLTCRTEIFEIRRDIKAVIQHRQILYPVEIAAESEIVHALQAVAAASMEIDDNEGCAVTLARRHGFYRASEGLKGNILLIGARLSDTWHP